MLLYSTYIFSLLSSSKNVDTGENQPYVVIAYVVIALSLLEHHRTKTNTCYAARIETTHR